MRDQVLNIYIGLNRRIILKQILNNLDVWPDNTGSIEESVLGPCKQGTFCLQISNTKW
jgi:hypothetical protein